MKSLFRRLIGRIKGGASENQRDASDLGGYGPRLSRPRLRLKAKYNHGGGNDDGKGIKEEWMENPMSHDGLYRVAVSRLQECSSLRETSSAGPIR